MTRAALLALLVSRPGCRRTGGCISKLCTFVHNAEVTFQSRGKKTLVFRGSRGEEQDILIDVPKTIEIE